MAMQDMLNTALYTAKRSAIREFSKLAAKTPDCVRLTLGEPDFRTPEPICAAVGQALKRGETHYIENNGTPALRQAIAAYEHRKNGMDYSADEIIVTAGATEALFTALFGIVNPGDEIIIPTPAFVLYEQIVNLCRGVFVPLDTTPDGFQISEERLESLITPKTKAIVLNSPNNPTGCILDRRSLEAVYHIVKDREMFVICDDVYRQLVYGTEYHSFAEYRDLRDRLLVVQSFSKPYAMTGWRMGYLMADQPVKERLELAHQFAVVSSAAPFQQACIEALSCDPKPMLEEYAKRRAFVLKRLQEIGMDVRTPEGAFYVFPSIAEYGMDSTTFCTRLLENAHVAVTPGAAFGEDGHIRISYCCSMDTLEKGMNRLESFVRSLNGGAE